MCIEHITDPIGHLEEIKQIMTEKTILVCSTCNADDALLKYYQVKEFADFTYWSEHVYLYNEETLTKLFKGANFKVLKCEQVQRYPLSNHLYWLNLRKPGGHMKYKEFNDEDLNREYTRALRKMKMCDSIMIYVTKK